MNLTAFRAEVQDAYLEYKDSADKAHIVFADRMDRARAAFFGDEVNKVNPEAYVDRVEENLSRVQSRTFREN